jgi:hypothetical protein
LRSSEARAQGLGEPLVRGRIGALDADDEVRARADALPDLLQPDELRIVPGQELREVRAEPETAGGEQGEHEEQRAAHEHGQRPAREPGDVSTNEAIHGGAPAGGW